MGDSKDINIERQLKVMLVRSKKEITNYIPGKYLPSRRFLDWSGYNLAHSGSFHKASQPTPLLGGKNYVIVQSNFISNSQINAFQKFLV